MKNLAVLILLFISFNLTFGQEIKIKHMLFDFKTKSIYEVEKQDSAGITLIASAIIQDLPILNKIEITKSRINPEKNNIKSVSDFAKFERWSISDFIKTETVISGVSEIGVRKVFYTLLKTEYFEDTRKTKLIGYKFENNNFILENGIAYSIKFSSELKLNDLENSNEESEFKTLDKIGTTQIMNSYINSGDLNKVIETLKIKK